MVPDDRSSSGGTSSFDFNSQAGVLVVLGAIRASALTPAERNELRDLVFLYSNGGGDPGVRTVLEERLREAGISAASAPATKKVVEAAPVPAAPRSGFTGGRPVPVFTPGSVSVKKVEASPVLATPAPAAAPSVATRVVPVMPQVTRVSAPTPDASATLQTPVPRSEAVVTPVAEPVPVPVRPVVVVPPPVRAPIAPLVPEPAVVMPVSTPTPAPAPTVPAPIIEPPAPATAARLERIRVIKSDVNNRVGNPVNLVALDKTIGSEYMSSLLEAMKLLSSASDVESERAMARLEVAYVAVDTLLKKAAAPVVTPTVPAESMNPVPPLATDNSSVVAQSSWSQPEPIASVPSVATIPQRPVAAIPIAPRMSPVPSTPVPPVPQSMVQSVAASQVPLRSIAELPTADEVNSASETGDPLFTKEVDSGLQQLLSEWSLFKKSGLFGTGPSGREHPLFLKMAPLAIPLLLAGRFEGSSQETKQSVTDYMNGWRYEQGIVYEKDETFEHYLRRVIRHIIDLQNKKRGA